MSYNPYGGRYTYGGSLKHYRTSLANGGSPNGVRKDGSKPIGKKAVGVIVGRRPDGTPIYSYGPQSAGQKARNTQALQNAVSGQQQNRSRNTEGLRQRVGIKAALDSRAINNNAGVVARREQRNRINAATATNAGSRGVTSREEAQRKGSRINANQYGNTFGNNVGRTADSLRAKGNRAVTETKKAIKNAPETIGNAAKDTRSIFRRGASAIGNWFNDRRKDLRTAGRSVGNWLGDRGRDIGRAAKSAYEAVSNSDERKAYEKAQANFRKNPTAENRKARDAAKKAYDSHLLTRLDRGAKQGARNVAKGAKAFFDYTKPGGTLDRKAIGAVKSGVEAAGRAISNQDEREAYERAEANFRKNPTAENRRARNEAKKAYDSHLVTQASRTATKAGQTVSRAASAVGSAAAEGASKAASTATQLASSASTAVNKVITDARRMASNAVPGASDIDKLYDNYKQANQLYNDLLRTDPKAAHKIESKVEDMRKAYVKAESQFNNSTEGKISNAISGKSKYMNRRK